MKTYALKFLNVLATGLFVVLGIPYFLLSLYVAFASFDQYISVDEQNAAYIKATREYVAAFQKLHGRMPASEDFSYWKSADYRMKAATHFYSSTEFSEDLIREFGAAPEGGYVLQFYVRSHKVKLPSWARSDSRAFLPDENFWMHGSRWGSVIFFAVWGGILLALATMTNLKLARLKGEGKPGPASASRPSKTNKLSHESL